MELNSQNRRYFLSGYLWFKVFAVFSLCLGMAACVTARQDAVQQAAAVPVVGEIGQPATAVFTPIPPTQTTTPSPTLTPTPTQTPTPTPTPTATAVSMQSQGDPRQVRLQDPIPQSGASCGLVDILDFPMNPPDAETITSGGRDFGVFRQRYNSYHAGEDWWVARGESNFGLPVYSIGHGTVTYAEPLGWGRDQGIVIVRHILTNGQTFLSFYGHLDPPSVTLRAGQCVTRGQKVGEIGRPRTPPHLHFEIRTHLPTAPGGGYWDIDPTQAGWLPPSLTIWRQRNTLAPGVIWTRPPVEGVSFAVGPGPGEMGLLLEEDRLVGVNLVNGRTLWQLAAEEPVTHAVVDEQQQRVVIASGQGLVAAYALVPGTEAAVQPVNTPLWQQQLPVIGQPVLLRVPDGGVLVSVRQRLYALNDAGVLLWEQVLPAPLQDYITVDNRLLLSSGRGSSAGTLWTATLDGLTPWQGALNGRFLAHEDLLLLYARDGIYRLDPLTETAVLHYPLPLVSGHPGAIIGYEGGGLLFLHQNLYDRRLIALNKDGSKRWERSLRGLPNGDLSLLAAGEKIYLAVLDNDSVNRDLAIYALDLSQPKLTHIYAGGSRGSAGSSGAWDPQTWIMGAGEGKLLVYVAGNVLLLDAAAAETAVMER